jgi:hypothetical protein
MVIVTTAAFPTDYTKEMGERFLKVPALPEFLTRKGPYFSSNHEDGIKSLSIYELDNEKVSEGMLAITEYMTTFYGVPGFSYDISVDLELEEGLKMIGLG